MSSADDLISSLRKEFENPTEWKRRQAFLKLNFNQLPFDRLVCLSHCFVNSSLNGAVYPERVMDEVEQYSRAIDVYLAGNGGEGDSGAANASSSQKRPVQKISKLAGEVDTDEPSWKRHRQDADEAGAVDNKRPRPLDLDSQLLKQQQQQQQQAITADNADSAEVNLDGINFTDFYLREIENDDNAQPNSSSNPANILKCSTDFCRRTLDYQFDNVGSNCARCSILMEGKRVSVLTAESKAVAKAGASAGLLTALRQRCWTLIVRSDRAFIRAQADAGIARPTADAAELTHQTTDKISSDNVGHRLLKGMGWSGTGGIGKRLDGRSEPVANDVRVVSRAGLGATAGSNSGASAAAAAFNAAINRVLKEFQSDPNDRDDLFFAADFDNEERRYVHAQCLRLGLASRSYSGDDGARCLVVSRKRTASELIDFVRRNGGATVRYRLVAPGDRETHEEAE